MAATDGKVMTLIQRAHPALGLPVTVVAVAVLAGCGSSSPSSRTRDQNAPAAGGVVRVFAHGGSFDLRIVRMNPRADAGAQPACLDRSGPVQFNLNWRGVDDIAVPTTRFTIVAADGTPAVIALGDHCQPAQDFAVQADSGTQVLAALALPASQRDVTSLKVTVDGAATTVPLLPTCAGKTVAGCSDDSLQFDPTNGYSVRVTVP